MAMHWWEEKKFRMIQNNFRDIDAGMDVDNYVKNLLSFGADTCMAGCGGITSFYPTKLAFQKKSPYLKENDDFIGRLVQKCHENGIRVIVRFDFSKTHVQFLKEHPEWYSKSIEGAPVLYNDTAATCLNGQYQQECSLEILEEVITRYPVDGVFFNMFGYQTWDYSNHYVGICQCDSCKKRFFEYCREILPVKEDEQNPVFIKYKEFQNFTKEDLLSKIYKKVKSLNEDVAVCTYSSRGVDLVRNESNSAVDRPYPFWLMASENNVSVIRNTYENKFSSNCCINAVDIFYRFMGVSPYLNALRLYGDMAAGGNLDWCIIGDFEDYPDRRNFQSVKEIFHFHKTYNQYFSALSSVSSILLVNPTDGEKAQQREYMGIFKMLKESHLLFDVFDGREEDILQKKIKDYQVIILPGIKRLSEKTIKILAESRAMIIGTGLSLKEDTKGLKKLFGVALRQRPHGIRSSYMLTEPAGVFRHFEDREWVYLDKDYEYMDAEEGNRNYLPLITPSMYGPPERCFGHQVTDQSCVSVCPGKGIYYSFMLGSLYYEQGYEDFKDIFMDVFDKEASYTQPVQVDAPSCVEVFFDKCGENEYLLQLMNYSGFNGTTFTKPLPISDIRVVFNGIHPDEMIRLGVEKEETVLADKECILTLPGLYECYKITCKKEK